MRKNRVAVAFALAFPLSLSVYFSVQAQTPALSAHASA